MIKQVGLNFMIDNNSILNKIPISLPRRDAFLLEGIRYAAGIINISYQNLKSSLIMASTDDNLDSEHYYIVFKEAWTIVDFSWKFRNILRQIGKFENEVNEKEFTKSDSENKLDLQLLDSLKEFRNTYQHLDERIDEVIVDKNLHVWGNISWIYVIDNSKILSCILSPGHPRSSVDVINPGGKIISSPICHISLQSINQNKNKIKLNISDLFDNVTTLIKQLEDIITPQLDLLDQTEKYAQDVVIKLTLERKQN